MTTFYKKWCDSNDDGVEFIAHYLQKQALDTGETYVLWSEYANKVRDLVSTELLDGLEIEEGSYFDYLIKGIVLGAIFTEEKQQEFDDEEEVHQLLFKNVRRKEAEAAPLEELKR